MREYEEYGSIIVTLPHMTDSKLKATHKFKEKQKWRDNWEDTVTS